MAGQQSSLREGYTTGTCAAAAAKAATACLLHGLRQLSVSVLLPPFSLPDAAAPSPATSALIPVERTELLEPKLAVASVIKDGGDDPDVTHKARIVVFASPSPFARPAKNPAMHQTSPAPHGKRDESTPLRELFADCLTRLSDPVYPGCIEKAPDKAPNSGGPAVVLYAGTGVGRVTLPGLPVPVGEPAINPVPREQIALAVREAVLEAPHGATPTAENPVELHLLICVPDGEPLSARTLNARLGIIGGISILGTGGIVRPYSHEAWTCAISQALSVAAALALPEILFTTGRRSERLGLALLPKLTPQAAIQAADYAAFAIRAASGYAFTRIHWACFPGKLLKLAQGLEWTHAQSGEADIGLLAGLCADAGASSEQCAAVAAMPTASGAFAILGKTPLLHDRVLEALARKAFATLRGWLENAGNSSGELCLHVFSMDERHLLSLPENNYAPRRSPSPKAP